MKRLAQLGALSTSLISHIDGVEAFHLYSYCFGGSSCVRLGGTDLVNSVVICHPGTFTIDQVKAIKVPTAWVCAEGIFRDCFSGNSL